MDQINESEFVYAVSTKSDGNMSFRYGEHAEVERNRRQFLQKYGIDLENCVVLHTPHEDHIEIVDEGYRGKGAFDFESTVVAESLMTNKRDVYLCLVVADCFPVVYYDPKQQVVAIAHLGWRPTDKKLAYKAVKKMQDEFGSNPEDLMVVIGPGTQKESYVMKDPQQKNQPEWTPFLEDLPSGETCIDLSGYIQAQLKESGIKKENIEIQPVDTVKSQDYFSHYRSQRTGEPEGRFLVVIGIDA